MVGNTFAFGLLGVAVRNTEKYTERKAFALFFITSSSHNKKGYLSVTLFFVLGAWQCATLTWGNPTLPSPLVRFTSEFEMESGGSVPLSPPGIN